MRDQARRPSLEPDRGAAPVPFQAAGIQAQDLEAAQVPFPVPEPCPVLVRDRGPCLARVRDREPCPAPVRDRGPCPARVRDRGPCQELAPRPALEQERALGDIQEPQAGTADSRRPRAVGPEPERLQPGERRHREAPSPPAHFQGPPRVLPQEAEHPWPSSSLPVRERAQEQPRRARPSTAKWSARPGTTGRAPLRSLSGAGR